MAKDECCPGGNCAPVIPAGIPRRDFLRLTALATVGVAAGPVLAQAERLAKFVPVEKGVAPALFARGERAVYRGSDLKFIGMPVGGICAGQVYLGGDGRLWLWDIFNEVKMGTVSKETVFQGDRIGPGGGSNYVDPPLQVHPFASGFALKIGDDVRALDQSGWKDVAFSGEYPMGFVKYSDPSCPVAVSLEAFSPFCPLDAEASALPAVVMRYTLHNTGKESVNIALGGWLENPVGLHSVQGGSAFRENSMKGEYVTFSLVELKGEGPIPRPAIRFEDWESKGFGSWKSSGDAFGPGAWDPGTVPGLGAPVGGPGKRFVKSYRIENGKEGVQGDGMTGRLTSPDFKVERRYIEFWVGGGNFPKTAYIGLVVDGSLVRSATGQTVDLMRLDRFEVSEFAGKMAHLEIVDEEKGSWGQIGVGRIEFVDTPSAALNLQPDFGEMAIGVLDGASRAVHDLGSEPLTKLFLGERSNGTLAATPDKPSSGVVREVSLAPGATETVSFAIAWRFPNLTLNRIGRVGNHYAERFATASAVLDHLKRNLARDYATTKKWHETWYDSTLPRWFLDRTMANTATLATMTCVRFGNGRFYAWEGIGCCDGTCGHVWGYAHTVGRLFPSLERSVREMADYKTGVGFREDTGIIDFRGEYGNGFAADSQAGYILRTLREHQTSPDDAFLKRVYPRMKKALECLIAQDGNDNGILEGTQHNTLDVNLYGPSSWLTSLYLAALRAGEEMAAEMGDSSFAKQCRTIFDRGVASFDKEFWNGEYYIHRLDEKEHIDGMRIGNGCEIDQLMGQGWAHQVGLGRIVGADRTKKALKSLFHYNFLPDVGPFRRQQKAGRWYAVPGEAGLLVCTFPKGDRKEILGPKPTWASMYFNEVWTGTEYQAAGHMIAEGLVDEGFRVVKAAHDRHHPSKRNPWNEVECSDHYARGMASYGAFISACGFEIHGPKGHLGFSPKVGASDFRAAFTAAEGWGTFRQKSGSGFEAGAKIRHGSLRLKSLTLDVPSGLKGLPKATVKGQAVGVKAHREGGKTTFVLAREVLLKEGDELVVHVPK
jgi:non-lysosomal glucosylceramidase